MFWNGGSSKYIILKNNYESIWSCIIALSKNYSHNENVDVPSSNIIIFHKNTIKEIKFGNAQLN